MSMFDEPPAFAGAETRLSLCFTRENMHRLRRRVVLEEGQIDEIEEDYSDEALFGADMLRSSTGGTGFASDTSGEEASYTESDTESGYSSMPELIDENGDVVEDELEYTRTENVEESARLWRELTSGNVPNEDIEHHVHRLADLTETLSLIHI